MRGNELEGYCFSHRMGKLRGWGWAVGLWFHLLREKEKGWWFYLASCCCTWLYSDQPGQGASCCQTENQYSALLRRAVHLPNCVATHTQQTEGTLVCKYIHGFYKLLIFLIMHVSWFLDNTYTPLCCTKWTHKQQTTSLDNQNHILCYILDFMVCFRSY